MARLEGFGHGVELQVELAEFVLAHLADAVVEPALVFRSAAISPTVPSSTCWRRVSRTVSSMRRSRVTRETRVSVDGATVMFFEQVERSGP